MHSELRAAMGASILRRQMGCRKSADTLHGVRESRLQVYKSVQSGVFEVW